ncbi:MAG: protein kinase [Polyangiales bacterium]
MPRDRTTPSFATRDSLDSFEAELGALLDASEPDRRSARELWEAIADEAREQLTLGETLGVGGFATVVRAQQPSGQSVAVKLVPVHGAEPDRLARIRREYRGGRRLSHPHVVRSLQLFEGGETWALTMELMEESLRARIARGRVPLEEVLEVVLDVLSALDHIHGERVVHRDLKPENVLLSHRRDGGRQVAKVADFGIARFGELDRDASLHGLSGTPAYMPPEAFDEQRFDPRGDLYALGLIALEMLSGVHPLGAAPTSEWPARHRSHPVTRPDGVPDGVWQVLRALVEKRPEARPRSAREVADRLGREMPARAARPPLEGRPYLASAPLVGREREVAELRAWLRARLGTTPPPPPVVTWVVGGAGVGKSRLLQALASEMRGWRTLYARALPGAGRPLAGLAGVLDPLRGAHGDDAMFATQPRGEAGESSAGAPSPAVAPSSDQRSSWLGLAAGHPEDVPDLEAEHRAFLRRQVEALLGWLGQTPTVIVVEDAHHLDEASLELIDRFSRAIAERRAPTAVLVTVRPPTDGTYLEAVVRETSADGRAGRIELPAWGPRDTQRLVEALLVDDPRSTTIAGQLHSEGITPLLVVQTLHVLLGRDALAEGGLDATSFALAQLPQTVQDAVGERATRLPGLAKASLALGAVLGSEFSSAELAAGLGTTELELLDHLDEAERGGFVTQRRDVLATYQFVHDELREAVLARLGEDLPALHRHAATALEAVHGGGDEVAGRLAFHFGAAGDHGPAYRWGLRAGAFALGQHGFSAAADHYGRALAAADAGGLSVTPEDLERWGDALTFSGRGDQAASAYERALDRCAPGDDVRRVALLARVAELEFRAARLTRATSPLEALLPRLGGHVYGRAEAVEATREAAERVLLASERAGAPQDSLDAAEATRLEVLCDTYRNLAEIAYYYDPQRRDFYHSLACHLAVRLGTGRAAAQTFALTAFLAGLDGRFEVAEVAGERALRVARELGDPVTLMFASALVGTTFVSAGDLTRALDASAAAWAIAQRVEEPQRMMTVVSTHALTLAAAGRADESAAVSRLARELGAHHGYTRVGEMAVIGGCAAAMAAGRFDDAVALAREADAMERRGSRMLALQLRSYGALARAMVEHRARPDLALDVVDAWRAGRFDSLVCNIDGNALLTGALAARHGLHGDVIARLDHVASSGRAAAERSRAKKGLFTAAAGLYALSQGRDEGRILLDEGLAYALRYGMRGDLALLAEVRARIERPPP